METTRIAAAPAALVIALGAISVVSASCTRDYDDLFATGRAAPSTSDAGGARTDADSQAPPGPPGPGCAPRCDGERCSVACSADCPCNGAVCTTGGSGADECAVDCAPGAPCNVVCAEGGDGCDVRCRSGSVCSVTCERGPCRLTCDEGSSCAIACGSGQCDVECRGGVGKVNCPGGEGCGSCPR